jgi:hypothetical protein
MPRNLEAHMAKKKHGIDGMNIPVQIEVETWLNWFQRGVFLTVERGGENIYGTDEFGYTHYAKVY